MGVALATRGGSAPEDAAAKLVPADALLYAHLSTKGDRIQDERLMRLASRFASVRAGLARLGMAVTPAAGTLRFDRDVRPWLGDEAAVAVLDAGNGRTEPMLVAAVRDRAKAEATIGRLGPTPAGTYRGTPLRHLAPRATAAFAGDFLVAGPDAAVRGALDRAAGAGGPALADSRVFRHAARTRDGSASAAVFATAPGLRRLLDGRPGLAGLARRLSAGPRLGGGDAR